MTRFAIIGAGGLGGPIAYGLASSESARITICDDDRVDLSNLQRQVQFTTSDIGRSKAIALADELVARGMDHERIRVIEKRFTVHTAHEILDGANVVIDGSDNFATKFAVNWAARERRLPLVVGAVHRYAGHVLVSAPSTGCYECLFEAPPAGDDTSSCAAVGVLGAAVAVIAGSAAQAALALAAGDESQAGCVLNFDDLVRSAHPRRVLFNKRPGCRACHETTSNEE